MADERMTGADLDRLRSFRVLAEELHFTRAAARLHLTQPALSQQVRALNASSASSWCDATPAVAA
jgi:hypothetical protein